MQYFNSNDKGSKYDEEIVEKWSRHEGNYLVKWKSDKIWQKNLFLERNFQFHLKSSPA